MTRMFPMTVIRLRDPATRMMSAISKVVYGLRKKRPVPLLTLMLLAWDELRISMLSSILCMLQASFTYVQNLKRREIIKHKFLVL